MPPPRTFKPTLHLRHQLTCSGITIDAAAYDARRHHVLTYDSHALKPHTLRLFSLRREIRTTPLFDAENKLPKATSKKATSGQGSIDPVVSTVLRYVLLVYAYELDVFVCIYSAENASTGYTVVIFEPASLKKLAVYNGPRAQILQCACFDESTGRLVLASRVSMVIPTGSRRSSSAVRVTSPSIVEECSNVVEVIEISKRPFQRPTSAISVNSMGGQASAVPQDRVMLCVERLPRATLWHSDPIDCIASVPGLSAFFGAGPVDDEVEAANEPTGSVILEWRVNSEDSMALTRRVVHEHDRITSLSTSPSGKWLFTGHLSGLINVWNMTSPANMDVNSQVFATIDEASPHKSAVSTIEVKPALSTPGKSNVVESSMLYSTERGSGQTCHWRFCAPVASSDLAKIPPYLDCLGKLDVDRSSGVHKAVKRRRRGAVVDWTRTIPLYVAVQMGSYSESLLVVARGDMIHVIKIQALLEVVHDIPQGEEIFALKSLPRQDGSAVVCLSGTSNFYRLRISDMLPNSTNVPVPKDIVLAAPTQQLSGCSIRLTRLEVCTSNVECAWIVCGWSTGVVEVYSYGDDETRRVALLQDPRLDVEITSLAVTNSCAERASQGAQVVVLGDFKPKWGGLLRSSPLSATRVRSNQADSLPQYIIFAGTASGAIFGWRISDLPSTHGGSFILEASIVVNTPPAHSAHVVDLVGLSPASDTLLSMGADGILKLWAVPSMRLVKHINAAASVGATGTRLGMLCSCVHVLNCRTVIVVGYEDGLIATWRRQPVSDSSVLDEHDYQELRAGGRHDRRVTSISDVGESRFLSASLDMTIVLWAIVSESNRVDELRFFELGEPVVDICVIGNIVVAGLRNESCWFTLDEIGLPSSQVRLPPPQEVVPQSETNLIGNYQGSLESECESDTKEMQPENSSPRSPSQPLRPPNEEDSVISVPSVIVPGSATNLESSGHVSRSGSSGLLEGWLTDSANDSPVDTEVISVYVRQYISSCGSSGTIAAENLGNFFVMHHLPLSKRTRPEFAVRKYLYERKIDPKTRLNISEATALVIELQQAAEVDRDDKYSIVKSTKPLGTLRQKTLKRLVQPRKKVNPLQTEKPVGNKIAVVTYNILGEKSIKWVEPAASNQEIVMDNPSPTPTAEVVERPTKTSSNRDRRLKKRQLKSALTVEMTDQPDPELLQRVHLSSSFRPMWSSGFCWCLDSQLSVLWDKHEDDNALNSLECSTCGHRLHRLSLQSKGYKPHFTARTILGIISDVYDMMMEPAHHLLFRNDESSAKELSIHVALWKLFLHKFGVQHVVESKLKLLFVSMCHLVREIDAVAVFGELLALFHRLGHDEQVPHKMVALCVVTRSWLYAREMVVNGESILGKADSTSESSKVTHWQFVSLTNALFCAQEVLEYPLVSPGYMQNILMYMEDYAQASATKPVSVGIEEQDVRGGTRWIEVHRLLRLLVGEWKQQTAEFRAVERLLFIEPLAAVETDPNQKPQLATVLEKLRLILSCFVFYDHERVGLAEVNDFEDILRRLKYLWPNEHLSEQEAAGAKRHQDSLTFENTILAAKKRFGDVEGDGRICYLDFWAMLYIIGVRTKSLLKFREIPSFCKDYKLEVSPALNNMLRIYMQRSSALLLPRGFHTAASSVDESTHHQHQRRVGGLYDGVYIVDKPNLTRTLSMEDLLSGDSSGTNSGLYIDGTVPSMRQNASTTALDMFKKDFVPSEMAGSRFRQPVVMGVRSIGPQAKQTAFLSMSSLQLSTGSNCDECGTATQVTTVDTRSYSPPEGWNHTCKISPLTPNEVTDSYSSIYIQFPNITPRKTRIEASESAGYASTSDHDHEAKMWHQQFLEGHEIDENERRSVHEEHKRRVTLQKQQAAATAAVSAAAVAAVHHRHRGRGSSPKEKHSPPKPEILNSEKDVPLQGMRRIDVPMIPDTSSNRVEDPILTIPTIEKHMAKAPLHGVSTIESLAHHNHSVPKIRQAHDLDSRELNMTGGTSVSDCKDSNSYDTHGELMRSDVTSVSSRAILMEIPMVIQNALDQAPAVISLPQRRSIAGNDSPEPKQNQGEIKDFIQTRDEVEHDGDENDDSSGDEVSCDGRSEDGDERQSNDELESQNGKNPEGVASTLCDKEDSKQEITQAAQPNPDIRQLAVEDTIARNTAEVIIATISKEPTREAKSETIVREDFHDSTPVVSPTTKTHEQADQTEQLKAKRPLSATIDPTAASNAAEEDLAKTLSLSFDSPSPLDMIPAPVSTNVAFAASAVLASPLKPVTKPITAELRHRFKFSQQPKFKLSAAVISNPFRSKQWIPGDDSNSEDSEGDADYDSDANDDDVAVEDMRMRLSRHSLEVLRKEYGRKRGTVRAAGIAALAFSSGTTRNRLEAMEGIYEDGVRRHKANNTVRLDEDAERALYGGRALKLLGEGIEFSADMEELMQHKWHDFFGTAEATMFSPLKDAIKQRDDAQREQEELQSRLMKKRTEEQHQDTLRLQRISVVEIASQSSPDKIAKEESMNFRARRMTREAALLVQHQVQLGETATAELKDIHAVEYFQFEYELDANAGHSIITFKVHVVQGEVDLFLSTQTTAPCSSDFMWRSVEKCVGSTAPSTPDLDAGQKIVLFPHDVARIVTGGSTKVVFYMAVVALVPNSVFTLGIMTSGQKAEPSRAIQTVENLIAHFNQLAKTYDGQASRRMNFSVESSASLRRSSSSGRSSVDRLRALLASATNSDQLEEEDDESDLSASRRTTSRRRSSQARRRQSNLDVTGGEDPKLIDAGGHDVLMNKQEGEESRFNEGSSFQYLLESFGAKQDLLSHSFVHNATADRTEFLQDEEARYKETVTRLSPTKNQGTSGAAGSDNLQCTDDGEMAAIAVATERRLSTAAALALQERLGARMKVRMSPLKASAKQRDKSDVESVSLRVARFEPKLAAYSLSALPPPKHPHQQLSFATTNPRTKNKR